MGCAISIEITFCESRSCESAVIENAPTRRTVATTNTEKRMWDIEFPPSIDDAMRTASYKHRQTQGNRGCLGSMIPCVWGDAVVHKLTKTRGSPYFLACW